MSTREVILSKLEKKWILERRVTRLSDNKEVQIYPMGAERYLSSVLNDSQKNTYNIKKDIQGKNVLIIPGYGTSCFIFAHSGAKSISVYDKDPVTIAWVKAFKKFYHYREHQGSKTYASIGELLNALTQWYPPLISLPSQKYSALLFWLIHPNSLRRIYIHYILSLVRKAVENNAGDDFELDQEIHFYSGTVDKVIENNGKQIFETAFVPYLLGVKNGIENEADIVDFIKKLIQIVPQGHILVNPSQNSKEFYIFGKRYFETTKFSAIQDIPQLQPYLIAEDKKWFRTQGLAVFGLHDTVE